MKKWLRRIRGMVGMGVIWGMVWFAAGLLVLLAIFLVGAPGADVPFPIGFGLLGFCAGVTFSGILGVIEGRRRFDQMSLLRFGVLGGAGGLLFSGIFIFMTDLGWDVLVVVGPVFTLSGVGCAAGSLALARIAEEKA